MKDVTTLIGVTDAHSFGASVLSRRCSAAATTVITQRKSSSMPTTIFSLDSSVFGFYAKQPYGAFHCASRLIGHHRLSKEGITDIGTQTLGKSSGSNKAIPATPPSTTTRLREYDIIDGDQSSQQQHK